MEEVAHGIDKDHLRLLPRERQAESVVVDGQGEASTVTGLADGFEAAGHAFGIAVGATGADFSATGDRVPSGLGPLDR